MKDTDKAISYLENAVVECDPWLLWIAADPRFDNLRGDSRFDELLRRIGFQNVGDEHQNFGSNIQKATPAVELEQVRDACMV